MLRVCVRVCARGFENASHVEEEVAEALAVTEEGAGRAPEHGRVEWVRVEGWKGASLKKPVHTICCTLKVSTCAAAEAAWVSGKARALGV